MIMSHSIKAALLSAFVFPGAGHLFLKKYISALGLSGAAFSVAYFLTTTMVERVLQITEKIQSGQVPLDVASINELVSVQSSGADAQALNIATIIFIVIWLVGIADSYRVGRKPG
ncbi:hypothetical protein MNBD_GAMMA25-138 [hydrothermal vent metagenome]|uniref:DUF5683 domain-containing protein n=1 Tax=hydrothermal vent metagenome TaxID=652676 RepID=A0A3B1BAT8_9ZZZZ